MPSDRVKVLYITATLKDGLEGVTGKRNPSVAKRLRHSPSMSNNIMTLDDTDRRSKISFTW